MEAGLLDRASREARHLAASRRDADTTTTMNVTVIMPMDRPGADADRALGAVLAQQTSATVEVIVVASESLPSLPGAVRLLEVADRNPAVRRNRAAAIATGEVLAFIDDDAFAEPGWIETAIGYLDAHPDVLALGGPDPSPDDSPAAELVSEMLVATPWIGSGIAAHENRPGTFDIESPHDIALVNLFVRRSAFDEAGDFDESIGYIGEDTALVAKLLERGRVAYHSDVVVRHRRRAFPGPYLRQRWRYRVKTGRLVAAGGYRNAKVAAFLAAGTLFLATTAAAPSIAGALLGLYATLTFLLGLSVTRLSILFWPLIPIAFALHHATYFAGLVTGIGAGMASRLAPAGAIHENTDKA